MTDILLVLSAARTRIHPDGSSHQTGVCAEEFVIMHRRFLEAGHNVVVATPGGLQPHFDANSLDDEAAQMNVTDMLEHLKVHARLLAVPQALSEIAAEAYEVVAIPGGYGPLEDLCRDPDLGRILVLAHGRGACIAAVCHGQAGLLSANDASGRWPFAGYAMTAFSDEEEHEFGVVQQKPWLIASLLRERGAFYQRGPKWQSFVVRDRNLFTGQNPASTHAVCDAVLAELLASTA